jgi:hypothetical protein
MADIDVVPKERSLAWVWWVVAIVVLIAALWWAFGGRSDTRTGRQRERLAPIQRETALDVRAGSHVLDRV